MDRTFNNRSSTSADLFLDQSQNEVDLFQKGPVMLILGRFERKDKDQHVVLEFPRSEPMQVAVSVFLHGDVQFGLGNAREVKDGSG